MALDDYGGLISNAGAAVPDYASMAVQQQMAHAQITGANLANQQTQMQMAMAQRALQRQQQFGQEMQSFVKNPTAEGLASLTGKFPEFSAQAKEAWGPLNEQQRRTEATQMGEIATMAANGQGDKAAELLQSRIDADQKAGIQRNPQHDQQVLAMLKSGDPQQIKAVVAMTAAASGAAVGWDHAADWLKSLGLSREPVKLAPGETLQSPQGGPPIATSAPLLKDVSWTDAQGVTHPGWFNQQTGQMGNPGTAPSQGAPDQGAPSFGEGGGPASGGGAVSGPRAVRNNNPGNLRATAFTKSQPGFAGTDDAGYAVFNSPAAGQAAQSALLMGKGYFGGGRKTVASIVSKWAPPKSVGGDNTSAQVANYISYVSKQLGVKPGDALSPQQIPQLAQAMAQFESGATGHAGPVRVPPVASAQTPSGAPAVSPAAVGSSSFGPGSAPSAIPNTKNAEAGFQWDPATGTEVPIKGGSQDLPPQMVDDMARTLLETGQLPQGMGMGGASLKKAVFARRSQIMQENGITPEQLPQLQARNAADKTAYSNITTIANGLSASKNTLFGNLNQVWETQKPLVKEGILGNTPFVNEQKLKYYEQFGTPAQKKAIGQYRLAINGATTDYAKFMSTQTGMGNAPSTDSARGQASDLLDESQPMSVIRGNVHQLMKEAEIKEQGVYQQKAALEHRLGSYPWAPRSQPSSEGPAKISTLQEYNALPPGTQYIDPNGVHRTKK